MIGKRSDLLDIIKGLMIIFIIITHFQFSYPEDYRRFGFFYWIDMAVPVFMIITGYLNSLNLEKNKKISQAYLPKTIITKVLRFLIPWSICILIEVPIIIITQYHGFSEIIKQVFMGGGMDRGRITLQ